MYGVHGTASKAGLYLGIVLKVGVYECAARIHDARRSLPAQVHDTGMMQAQRVSEFMCRRGRTFVEILQFKIPAVATDAINKTGKLHTGKTGKILSSTGKLPGQNK